MHKYKPDLKEFMSICAINYAKMLRLVSRSKLESTVSRYEIGESNELVFELIEHSTYTDTYQVLQKKSEQALDEALCKVRLYHDAKVAEVIAEDHPLMLPPVYPYPNSEMKMPNEKIQLNRFLGEWLSFCLQFGQAHSSNKTYLAFL